MTVAPEQALDSVPPGFIPSSRPVLRAAAAIVTVAAVAVVTWWSGFG